MAQQTYRISKGVLLPLVLVAILLLVLLGVSLVNGEVLLKLIILVAVLIPVVLLLLTNLKRRVDLSAEGVRVVRPVGEKYFRWDELTSFEAVSVRGRAFVTLCAGEDFVIISNSYEKFADLVEAIAGHLPEKAVSPEANRLIEHPTSALAGVLPLWFGVLALIYILWHQFAAGN
ncbi:hypothetical protein C2E25_15005 [Geothermobacter hydrogeniphilus]|uniref:PH domain-containing protein n=1 Tax=Geothermobacter hydrogeniphilus TaxID=1969733 RepID=A0A2K2H6I5_9BACT|nr:hypothetical protein [Geothermobacter hydrogeniphilus]PNU18935.1 hypothetical protein C2E25_15005 [Geothermobacter hydrogeniphilus]